jgi:hypothetical protein
MQRELTHANHRQGAPPPGVHAFAAGALLLACLLLVPALLPAQSAGKDGQAAKDSADSKAAKESKEKEKGKDKAKDLFTNLRVELTGGEKSVAVDSASVYVKYPEERRLGKDRMVEMNLKTNRDGVASVPAVPRGKVLIQVIAPGWKTFGQWFDLTQEDQTIKINLQKPPRWY